MYSFLVIILLILLTLAAWHYPMAFFIAIQANTVAVWTVCLEMTSLATPVALLCSSVCTKNLDLASIELCLFLLMHTLLYLQQFGQNIIQLENICKLQDANCHIIAFWQASQH